MSRPIFALFVALVFLPLALAAPAAQAQILQAELKVKGLACPFCAYGLERKLKKLPGAKTVEVIMDENVARMRFDREQSPAIDEIPKAVHDAGFELGELRLTVLGKRATFEGRPALELSGGQVLLLKRDAMAADIAEGTLIEVTGVVRHAQPSSHHGHPYTMEVESFQVTKQGTQG